MQKLKKGFREFFLIATVISLLFVSCRHPKTELNNSKTENITVTVNKDEYVIKAPSSFTLEKGTKLGFTALNEKMPGLEFAEDYEIANFMLNDATGAEITDLTPHTFNENTTIFISSQKKREVPTLISLKIDHIKRNIDEVIDFGKTTKEKVLVEANISPKEAIIDFEPKLVDYYWNLKIGKNELKIKVKKDALEKDYKVNIERIDSQTPVLTKITVADETREGDEISSNMVFYVDENTTKASITAQTKPENTEIVYDPPLQTNELNTTEKETKVKLTLGGKTEYYLNIKKLAKAKTLITDIFALGERKNGISLGASEEEREKILNGENIVVALAGDEGRIIIGSEEKEWKTVRFNGILYSKEDFPTAAGYKSTFVKNITIPKDNTTLSIAIEVDDGTDMAKLNFRVKRYAGTIDVPVNKLFIRGSDVINNKSRVYKELVEGGASFDGSEPSRIVLSCPINMMKSVKINDAECSIKEKNGEWLAEGIVEGIKPSGKDITITVEPMDSEKYNSITWKFHLDYVETENINVIYEINGVKGHKLPKEFQNGLKNNSNPLIQVDSKLLNIKMIFNTEIKEIRINEKIINGEKLKRDQDDHIFLYSLPITEEEKQILMDIKPVDEAAFNAKSFKFKVQGSQKTEKISPTFEEISGDSNFPKATFLDKLEGEEKPVFKTISKYADIVIGLTSYECEFLCEKVKVNGKDEKIVITDTIYGTFYNIKKTIPLEGDNPSDVKIEFIAKEGMSENINWTFQVQRGNEAPSLPQKLVTVITINEIGEWNKPKLPKEFLEHLIDGTNPVYVFDGTEAVVEIGAYKKNPVKNVIFKFEGEQKYQAAPTKRADRAYTSKYAYKINDREEHLVQIIIEPKDEKYSPLILNFKIKWSGKN